MEKLLNELNKKFRGHLIPFVLGLNVGMVITAVIFIVAYILYGP